MATFKVKNFKTSYPTETKVGINSYPAVKKSKPTPTSISKPVKREKI